MNSDGTQERLRAAAGDRWSRRVLGVVVLVAAVWLAAPALAQAQEPGRALECKFKAGYLFNLVKFIAWPDTASASTNQFIVGVMGSAEVVAAIQNALRDKLVDNRPFLVKPVTSSDPIPACHILFVSREAGKSSAEVQQQLGAAATLLVGETDQFAERGGMVGFVRRGNTFYLTLNLEAATQAGLKVSAKLANVARMVTTQAPN